MASSKLKGLTIEIGGDTTSLDKALSGVNKNTRSLQGELRELDRLLKLDPSNTELLQQKQKLLADAVENSKEKVKTLSTALDQASADRDMNEEQFRALQREVIKAEQSLEGLEKQAKDFGSTFKQQMEQAGAKVGEFGGKVETVGEGLSKGITAPVLAVGAASQVAFNEVDTALDTIVAKTGATGDAMDGLEASFRTVYGNLPVDAQAAGEAVGEVNKQFSLTGEALERSSDQVLKFAEINGQDVASATTAAKEAVEAYGLSANDLSGVLDAVTKTAQNTGVATDKIFDSVVKGAPQLKAMGLDFAQSAEMVGRFEQKGLDGSKALSYLSKARVTFAKEGKTMAEGLGEVTKKIENSSSETEALTLASEYFGTKGATFMLDAIQRGALNFEDFAGAAANAEGSVAETFESTIDPIDGFTVAMNNLKLVGNDIATMVQGVLAPSLENVVGRLRSFADWFKNLPPGMQELIVKIALIAAAIGPVLITVGKLITAVGSIMKMLPVVKTAIMAVNTAMAANPIGAIITAIALIIGVLMTLWNTNEGFRNAVIAILDTVKAKFLEAWEFIKGIWDAVAPYFAAIWDGIKIAFSTVAEVLGGFFSTAWAVIKFVWDVVVSYFTGIWEGVRLIFSVVQAVLSGDFQGAWNAIKNIWDAVSGYFRAIWTVIKTIFSPVIEFFRSIFGNAWTKITEAFASVKAFFDQKLTDIKGVFSLENFKTIFNDSIVGGLGSIVEAAEKKAGEIWQKIKDVLKKPFEFFFGYGGSSGSGGGTGGKGGLGWTRTINRTFAEHGYKGMDFGAPTGTPVGSPVAGRVIVSRDIQGSYGRYVVIMDTLGNHHYFAHLSRRMVPVGAMVPVGGIIGLSGSTGKSTGPHVHYEVRGGGSYSHQINPMRFIRGYATGGFPAIGEIFQANENGIEMMGKMGSKPVIANNTQITEGIAAALQRGMTNAIMTANAVINGGQQLVTCKLDPRDIVRAITGMQVVLDSGAVVGGLYPLIDKRLTAEAQKRGRGR